MTKKQELLAENIKTYLESAGYTVVLNVDTASLEIVSKDMTSYQATITEDGVEYNGQSYATPEELVSAFETPAEGAPTEDTPAEPEGKPVEESAEDAAKYNQAVESIIAQKLSGGSSLPDETTITYRDITPDGAYAVAVASAVWQNEVSDQFLAAVNNPESVIVREVTTPNSVLRTYLVTGGEGSARIEETPEEFLGYGFTDAASVEASELEALSDLVDNLIKQPVEEALGDSFKPQVDESLDEALGDAFGAPLNEAYDLASAVLFATISKEFADYEPSEQDGNVILQIGSKTIVCEGSDVSGVTIVVVQDGNIVDKAFVETVGDAVEKINELLQTAVSESYTVTIINEAVLPNGDEVTQISDVEWQVKNAKGETHKVQKKNDSLHCDCTGFKFKHTCRHVSEVQDTLDKPIGAQRYPISMAKDMIGDVTRVMNDTVGEGNWKILGSYARKQNDPNYMFKDFDIVVFNTSREKFLEMGKKILALPNVDPNKPKTTAGEDIFRAFYRIEINGEEVWIEFDCSRTREDNTNAAMELYRTGPAKSNTFMRQVAISKGWSLSEKGILDHITGEPPKGVKQDTQEDIYKALGLPYQPPTERDNWEALNTPELQERVRQGYINVYYGPRSIIKPLAKALEPARDKIEQKIQKSKSEKGFDEKVLYAIRSEWEKMGKPVVKLPYRGEFLRVYEVWHPEYRPSKKED